MQLQKLDEFLRWEALRKPTSEAESQYVHAHILDRRPAASPAPPGSWEYLVELPLRQQQDLVGFCLLHSMVA